MRCGGCEYIAGRRKVKLEILTSTLEVDDVIKVLSSAGSTPTQADDGTIIRVRAFEHCPHSRLAAPLLSFLLSKDAKAKTTMRPGETLCRSDGPEQIRAPTHREKFRLVANRLEYRRGGG